MNSNMIFSNGFNLRIKKLLIHRHDANHGKVDVSLHNEILLRYVSV